jgi:xanthine dehydrogenase small subunit
MRDFLLIYVNGQRHEIRGERAFQSLSSFLRYDLGLIGTKVVCAEGDCGSCTVLLGRADGGGITYRAVTSCIQFLFQLDATHIVTVEGLKENGKPNAVQEAMIRCQGAQCGFCTPGFVVSMCGLLEERVTMDEKSLRAGLVGNLCRCTGYESILKAGLEVASAQMKRVDDLYPPQKIADDLRAHAAKPVRFSGGPREFFKPVAIADACDFRAAHPDCTIIAGGTDVGVQINKGIRDPAVIMSLAGLTQLRETVVEGDRLIVGALATLADLEHETEQLCPEFGRMLWRHGSPLIRNAGTLAGNIANASPIGDTMPALYVLNGEIELTGRSGSRRVNINDFYTGYRKTVMASDELITRVIIPLHGAGEDFRLYKVSKRHDLDISTFTAAFWMRRENGVIADLRIAYGGCGPNIYRLRKTEQALIGKPFSEAEIDAAAEIARTEVTPISDVRGDAEYRFTLAENMLRKFHADITGGDVLRRVTDPGRTVAGAVGYRGNGNGEAS